MAIWAIGDLHLSFGVPNKGMEVFGESWNSWTQKLENHWRNLIKEDDLILIPGDISWAMHLEDAIPDLNWIHQLPGTKVMIRGNHDYWWSSLSQIEKILPPSIHIIQNNAFNWKNVTIGGAKLWDTSEYNFGSYINYLDNPRAKKLAEVDSASEADRLFKRELGRLEMSLKSLSPHADVRIAMTHYPPISADLNSSQAACLFEKYKIDICVFGHLHNVKQGIPLFGKKNQTSYYLTSCDYLDFIPIKILDLS